jgi:hypothetical protein
MPSISIWLPVTLISSFMGADKESTFVNLTSLYLWLYNVANYNSAN